MNLNFNLIGNYGQTEGSCYIGYGKLALPIPPMPLNVDNEKINLFKADKQLI
jgi:hypothetical protein